MARQLFYSFQPDGLYFIFDLNTGRTLRRDIINVKRARYAWSLMQLEENEKAHNR